MAYRKKKRYYKKRKKTGQPAEVRVRLPREGEIFGIVEELHGSRRMRVKCGDDKIRLCRVPGRLKRIWVRPDDYVLVKPWSVESDKKGDIVWRYKRNESDWLKNRGYLKDL